MELCTLTQAKTGISQALWCPHIFSSIAACSSPSLCQKPQAAWYMHLSSAKLSLYSLSSFQAMNVFTSPFLLSLLYFHTIPSSVLSRPSPLLIPLSLFFSSQLLLICSLKFYLSTTFWQSTALYWLLPPLWCAHLYSSSLLMAHLLYPSPFPVPLAFFWSLRVLGRCWHPQPLHLAVSVALSAVAWILPYLGLCSKSEREAFSYCFISGFSFPLVPVPLITVKAFSSSSFVLSNGSSQALPSPFSLEIDSEPVPFFTSQALSLTFANVPHLILPSLLLTSLVFTKLVIITCSGPLLWLSVQSCF